MPNSELIKTMSTVVDKVNDAYTQYLDDNDDYDDIYHLADLLNAATKEVDLSVDIIWANYDDERSNPNEWISAMATPLKDRNKLLIILWGRNLEDKWGPKTFKEIVLKTLGHETIHFEQYRLIGMDKLQHIKSGHQKGQADVALSGDDLDYYKMYLSDPHELMAYGHDLCEEAFKLENVDGAIRNPEEHIKDLPVYQQYREFFNKDSKIIKRLLHYAACYYLKESINDR